MSVLIIRDRNMRWPRCVLPPGQARWVCAARPIKVRKISDGRMPDRYSTITNLPLDAASVIISLVRGHLFFVFLSFYTEHAWTGPWSLCVGKGATIFAKRWPIFRPAHRSDRGPCCRQSSVVGLCVCVRLPCAWALQKRLTRSRCRLGDDSSGPNWTICIRWVPDHPRGMGNFWRLSGLFKNIDDVFYSVRC